MTDVVYVTAHAQALVVSVACLALSAARGDRPVNRGGHQVTTSAACPAVEGAVLRWTLARTDQRLDGCGAKDSTCSWISWTSDISLCAVAVVHGECWKQSHQERLVQHHLDVFQVTASDFGVERRSSVEGGQQDSLESIVSFVAV